jgi:hypothetical protein
VKFIMRRAAYPLHAILIIIVIGAALLIVPSSPRAQSQSAQLTGQEIIANLATGRVVICVAKDAILVGAESEKSEPGSHSPLFVPLTGGHVAVLLGAVEWVQVNSGRPPIRLDTELGKIGNRRLVHPIETADQNEATDLEVLGIAFLERLRAITGELHHELKLKDDEPIVQILVVGYQKDYGPEAWVISYKLQQRLLRDDYWDTLAQRPSYLQIYPPEKKAPHTIVEVKYPTEIKGSSLQEMLQQNDARLIPIRSTDAKVGQAAQFMLDGATQKANSEPATVFFRKALEATAPKESKLTIAILHEGDRFDWIIPPPEEVKPGDDKRDSAAPTLRAPHH